MHDGEQVSSNSARTCGPCSLCCTVLRVDELGKLGGAHCVHQNRRGPGCSIHPRRPGICRAYRCLWLSGGLEGRDRPDRLGAVLDIVAEGPLIRLEIRESKPGCFDSSERLAVIANQYRESMPVRITDVGEVLNPSRVYRLLLPKGEVHRVEGDWTEIHRPGEAIERRRLSMPERLVRRMSLAARRVRLRRAMKQVPPTE